MIEKKRRLRIAIGHPRMGRGGSEAVVMWGIQALKDDYQVALVTTGHVGCKELEELNQFYGTSLQWGAFDILEAPVFPGMRKRSAAALRGALFQRFCWKVADQFDVLVSAYNLCDFGKPGIQLIADFSWDMKLLHRFDPMPVETQRVIHRNGWLRQAYLACARTLMKPSGRNLFSGDDLLVMNSQWTGRVIEEEGRFGVKNLPVLFPPVVTQFPQVPWQAKEWGFVCIGRISYEKRIEAIIEILRRVRERGHNIHLHMIGPIDQSPYGRMIRHLCELNSTWIKAEGSQSGAAKAELLASHRFGIHARPHEAFGISVAEMVAAGCITFVPNSGGPVEIVDDHSLCYKDIDDAVEKIDAVLRSPERQAEIAAGLPGRAERFSTTRFMREFRSVVENFTDSRLCSKRHE